MFKYWFIHLFMNINLTIYKLQLNLTRGLIPNKESNDNEKVNENKET